MGATRVGTKGELSEFLFGKQDTAVGTTGWTQEERTLSNLVADEIQNCSRYRHELESIRATLMVNIKKGLLPEVPTEGQSTHAIMFAVLEVLTKKKS